MWQELWFSQKVTNCSRHRCHDRRHRRICARLLYSFLLVAGLQACSLSPQKPDLQRLYKGSGEDGSQPPVILIPGLMGSRLVADDATEIWPGSILDLLFSSYRDAALEINPETLNPNSDRLRAGTITGKFAGRDFYNSITETLESAGDFERATPGRQPPEGRHYYIFTYDWRLDNVETARHLDRFIERIRADHGDPDLKVDIIAHSMGGLIARYYMRYGTVDVTTDNDFPVNYHGEQRIRRIVLLGTPNLGSVEALKAFIVGRQIGLRTIAPETLITFPSFYQLFTHPLNDWLLDIEGQPLDVDPFDLSTWKRFEWSIFDPEMRQAIIERHDDPEKGRNRLELLQKYFHKHIERGRRFMWSLTVSMDRTPWRLVVFGGDCELTPARMVVEKRGDSHRLHLAPEDIESPRRGVDYERLMLEPGDGTITKASLLAKESLDPTVPRHKWSFFPLDYPLFLCENHGQLTGNRSFQNNLLNFLLNRN